MASNDELMAEVLHGALNDLLDARTEAERVMKSHWDNYQIHKARYESAVKHHSHIEAKITALEGVIDG